MLKILFLFFSVFFTTYSIADDMVMKVVPLNNRFASDIQPLISPFLENSEYLIANGSSLIIKATPARQNELKKLIGQLDKQLSKLTITIIQSNSKTADSLNASANIRIGTSLSNKSKLSGGLRGRFADIEKSSYSESRQQIQTLDGKTAFIKTGKVHPVHNTNILSSSTGYTSISSNTQYIEASTGFLVIPRLSGTQVTLEVSPWSDKMKNSGVLSTQRSHTTIRVRLGEWVEIGGINEQSQSTATRNLSHSYSTRQKKSRILIKIDKTH